MTQTDLRSSGAVHFCTVAYSDSRGVEEVSGRDVILIAMGYPQEGWIQLKERRGWRESVREQDQAYVSAVLRDIVKRTSLEPQVVYRQLSELSIGPLVTHKTGTNLHSDKEVLAISLGFDDLLA